MSGWNAPASPLTVLVTDDSALLRSLFQTMLENSGYHVIAASNGLIALQLVQQSRPDAVLMDIEMPVMDGFEACRRLKADPATADLPIVIISTRVLDGQLDVDEQLLTLADAYLTKPIRLTALLTCLDRLLAGPHTTRESA